MRNAARRCLMLAVGLALVTGVSMGAELQVGDPAPDFQLQGSDGKTYRLADYKDKMPVVLAWFPKAFTGG